METLDLRLSIHRLINQKINQMNTTRASFKDRARYHSKLQVNSSFMTSFRQCLARSEICQRHLTRQQEMLRTENRWYRRLHDHKNSCSGRNQAIPAKAALHKNQCSSWWCAMKPMVTNLQLYHSRRWPTFKMSQIGQIPATRKLKTSCTNVAMIIIKPLKRWRSTKVSF